MVRFAPRRRTCPLGALGFVSLFLVFSAGLRAQTPVVRQLRNTGPNANRINVVLLGDGFTAAEQEQFFTVAQQKLDTLSNNESFALFKDLINGYAIFTASNESGTDVAADSVTRDTYYDAGFTSPVNTRLLIVGSSAGATRAQTVLRANVPDYDIALMVVNSTLYGGAGGIPTVFSLNAQSDEIMLHETGHAFAKLADEYVDVASAPFYPPAEFANATQKNTRADLSWRAFVLDSTPIPTTTVTTDANFVGLWEGAHYRATGFYRPIYDSKMRSLSRPFGPVNLRAFASAIHRLNLNLATALPSGVALQSPVAHAAAGGTLSLGVTAQGIGPFTYQWSLNGKYLVGQIQPTLTLTNVGAASVGPYNVEVTNGVGTVTSAATGLTAQVVASGSGASAVYDVQLSTQSVVQFARAAVYVSEQSGLAVLTLVRGGNAVGVASVSYATAPGTATSPADFTAQSGTITWAAGDAGNKVIAIPLVADNLAEGIENFTVALSAINGASLVGEATATVYVADAGVRDPNFASDFINGSVTSLLPLVDGSMLVAGGFTSEQSSFGINYFFGGIARLTSTGVLDTSFKPEAGADSTVRVLAGQPDGKIFIGGNFTSYNGTARNRIARLNADGSLDPTFNPGTGADGTVYDLLLQADGKLIIAGAFVTINGTAREYLARLNPDGSVDSGFVGPDFGGTSGWWVRSLTALPDGKIIAGGVFFFAGTNQRASLCRLNANGSVDASFSGVVQGADASFTAPFLGEIRKVARQPDGKFVIGGDISSFNKTSRRGIARVTADGSLDPTFNPGTGTELPVDAVTIQADGKFLVGGTFTSFNGTAVSRLARLNADGSLDSTFGAAGGSSSGINAITIQSDGNILLGGSIGSLQGATPNRPVWRLFSNVVASASPPSITSVATVGGVQGAAFSFSVTASNFPAVFSATNLPAGLSIDSVTGVISGRPTLPGTSNVTVTATNAGGSGSQTLAFVVSPAANPGRLVNLSVLAPLSVPGDSFSLGYVVSGAAANNPKPLVIRAAGPSLGALGVAGTLADPKLELFAGSTKTGENDNWGGSAATTAAMAAVGAFAYAGPATLDAAVAANITSRDNSVKISVGASAANGTGTVIAEVYDSTPAASFTTSTPRLINFSVIKSVGSSVTLGFVIGGATNETVLVRAIGPTLGLAPFNVGGAMADPKVELFDAAGKSLATNDNWGGTTALTSAFGQTGAFALSATTSKDAALVATLAPGNYSVVVTPVTGTAGGTALLEVYEVP